MAARRTDNPSPSPSGEGPRRTPPNPPAGPRRTPPSRKRSAVPLPPRTGPPPPSSSRVAQRVLAVFMTVLVFGLVVFGMGAATATFGERWWGYAIGGLFCVLMVIGAVRGGRK
ncbi:hypothetical protein MXD59_19840 [Frankia sp. Ag45/Mut15]|uniref:Integral membrane protein n=1 Tax=Frankia umida TaxID=573489 RepID=A0ABT0K2I3_9ACTN|nr:hypothetical protein [Frankia umida]MCK9877996.1 hypothetical protein [Frankia umida]